MSMPSASISFRQKIEQIESLPALPEISRRLLKIQQDQYATVQQLSELCGLDLFISSQLLKYANSAFFGAANTITSLDEAISRIGFNNALNIAIGLSTAKSFKISKDGPIGLRNFWQHAIYSALIMQSLANKLQNKHELKSGLAYLAGLLHNIGFVLFSYSSRLVNSSSLSILLFQFE